MSNHPPARLPEVIGDRVAQTEDAMPQRRREQEPIESSPEWVGPPSRDKIEGGLGRYVEVVGDKEMPPRESDE